MKNTIYLFCMKKEHFGYVNKTFEVGYVYILYHSCFMNLNRIQSITKFRWHQGKKILPLHFPIDFFESSAEHNFLYFHKINSFFDKLFIIFFYHIIVTHCTSVNAPIGLFLYARVSNLICWPFYSFSMIFLSGSHTFYFAVGSIIFYHCIIKLFIFQSAKYSSIVHTVHM